MSKGRRFKNPGHPGDRYSDVVEALTTGGRSPSRTSLLSTLGVFRDVPMSAFTLGLRTNCPPTNVLTVLQQLEADGVIRRTDTSVEEVSIQTKWVIQ